MIRVTRPGASRSLPTRRFFPPFDPPSRHDWMAAAAVLAALLTSVPALAGTLRGDVRASDGSAVVGALVTVEQGRPAHGITVFTDHTGAFHFDELDTGDWRLRVRRIGWRDHAEPATVPAAMRTAIAARAIEQNRLVNRHSGV